MKHKISTLQKLIFSSSLVFCCILLFGFEINAQTRRAQPVPIPEQNTPIIISRAGNVPVENQQPIIVPDDSSENNVESTENLNDVTSRLNELRARLNVLEENPTNKYDAKQKRLLLNLDILARSEQRAESLRKQLFDLTEKQGEIQSRLDQIEYNLRPEAINSAVAVAGTLRPEELRRMRSDSLKREQTNLQNLLTEIETNKQNLEFNVQKADALVDKLRLKLEKEIDDALNEEYQ